MDTTTARYAVLGTTDDYEGCDCCGRSLDRVRWIRLADTVTGEEVTMGTTCAARAMGVRTTDIARDLRTIAAAEREAARLARQSAHNAEQAAYAAWCAAEFGTSDPWAAAPLAGVDGAFGVWKLYRAMRDAA